MRIVADFHVHSKYARATSSKCEPAGLEEGAKIKGINVIATGDFTHPAYFEELKRDLMPDETTEGLYTYRDPSVKFILSTELAISFELNGKNRRMHHVVLAPSIEEVAQIIDRMGKYGSLEADGRPMLKLSCAAMIEELESVSKRIVVIPAHVWTPWFSIFGSKAGVDSVDEAFEDKSDRIFALETGLSSDPSMNWMLSSLDRYSLVSNSDAHSPGKLGREANVFDLAKPSYDSIMNSIRTRKGFVKTYEFYPEEGKYHYDGHRDCDVLLTPYESKAYNNICPSCRKKLTIGVLHRVADLADRKQGFIPDGAVPFQSIVPLPTAIGKALKRPETSVVVAEEYSKLIRYFGNEFAVYEASEDKLRLATSKEIADALVKVNTGKVRWVPGYDGVFGQLILDDSISVKRGQVDKKQKSLGDF